MYRFFQPFLFIFSFSLIIFSVNTNTFAESKTKHEVEDLAYGLSLYHFYQGKHFSAITDILVAKHYKRLQSKSQNPDLLLGGLYLSYGLQHKSAAVFSKIISDAEVSAQKYAIKNSAPSSEESTFTLPWSRKKLEKQLTTAQYAIDRAWFQLGKKHYKSGFMEYSEKALTTIEDTLNDEHEAERLFLLANIYSQTNRLQQAKQTLHYFASNSIWYDYAKFNIGTGLIRNNQLETGIQLLTELAKTTSSNRERRILQDKANLALAYTALKTNNHATATRHFETVRLNDSEASKALLGIGWAWYKQAEFDKSLTPWMELANREKSDPAVQEALISIPSSFEKINNHYQALQQYDIAIDIYQQQLNAVEEVLQSIHSGAFIKKLKHSSLGEESRKPFSILFNINASSNQYLLPLISSNEFHDALKTYQEAVHLSYTLNHWQRGLPALELILGEKIKRYNSKLTDTVHSPKIKLAGILQKNRQTLASRLLSIIANEDALKLATVDEQKQLSLLRKVRKTIAKNRAELKAESEQQRLLYGLIYWNIVTDYKPRIWAAQKNLQQLDQALYKMNRSVYSLNKVWKNAPAMFTNFSKQVKDKSSRISSLKIKMRTSLQQQEKHLKNMAVKVIYQQRDRLQLYNERAMFARARIYDSLIVKNSNERL
jgi:alkylhydroperoxidase/carboxymuconolactone decarboxylase family protein YurZ